MIRKTEINYDLSTGELRGGKVKVSEKKLIALEGIFEDTKAFKEMDGNTIVYHVQTHENGEDGKNGGLFFGTSFVHPGKVGDEYFMTKGHFHAKADAGEYYWCISGHGYLILQEESGECIAEEMKKGSLHYIPGRCAHRLVNTGDTILSVGACWPSDAGHDYAVSTSFNIRIKQKDGKAVIENKKDLG